MSKYTTEVRFICENFAGLTESVGYTSTNKVIADAREKVFDFPYPIFDENYRSVLETKILKHFYTREIGAESIGLWKLWLDTKLNEVMPYYNQLYKSELIEFNPMYDVDLTTDHVRNVNGNENRNGSFSENSEIKKDGEFSENSKVNRDLSGDGSSDTNGNSHSTGGGKTDRWEYYSDTPQGGITGLASMNYLTNARHITDNGLESSNDSSTDSLTENEYNEELEEKGERSGDNKSSENGKKNGNNSSNATMSNIEDYLEHIKGKTAGTSYSKRLQEFRQTFLNIDMQVIGELNDLFMNLW